MKPRRVIVIGFEAVEPSLLLEWVGRGQLPNFARCLEGGSFGLMRSPAEVSSGGTWSSINCGVKPGKHGIGFCHRQFLNGTYDVRKKRADELGREPFWWALSDQGKQLFEFDIPEVRIKPDFNGIQVTGWGLECKSWKTDSVPNSVIGDIVSKFGRNPIDGWYQTKPAPEDYDGWRKILDLLLTGITRRTSIINHYLRQQKWDLALAVFAETHLAGHLFWHLCDPEHPEYHARYEAELGSPILRCLQQCDQGLGEFLEIDPEAVYVIVSNTGMGPNYSARHLLGPVLGKLGYSKESTAERKGLGALLKPAGDAYAVERIEKLVGTNTLSLVRSLFPEKLWDQATRKFLNRGNSWPDSIAFAIPGDNTGSIRINLRGREPKGKVAPEDYDKVCRELTESLLSLTLPDGGGPAVKEVVRVHEKYPGENNGDLPDLVVKWNDDLPINSLQSERLGTITHDHLPDKRSGAHRDFGFFMAVGPGIAEGVTLAPLCNWDVAPTILSLMGQSIPEDMDGRPVQLLTGQAN